MRITNRGAHTGALFYRHRGSGIRRALWPRVLTPRAPSNPHNRFTPAFVNTILPLNICTFALLARATAARYNQVMNTSLFDQVRQLWKNRLNWSKHFGTTSSSEMPYQVRGKSRRLSSTGGFRSMLLIPMM